jgi:nucleoside diphosphate kinase
MSAIGPQHGIEVPPELTRDPAKRLLFGADTYFQEGWDDLERIAGDNAVAVAHDHGLVLLKPDAVAQRVLRSALEWFLDRDATIVAALPITFDPRMVRAMWQYQFNCATRDRRELADMVTSVGPSMLLLVRLPPSPVPTSVRLSAWKGPADPRRREPGELRYALGGGNFLLNYVHAADEPADLPRELAVLLPRAQREELMRLLAGLDPAPPNGLAQAWALATELERSSTPHDLELATALGALRARAGTSERSAALRAELAAVERGESRDWRGLRQLAIDADVDPGHWDTVVIGTQLMDHSHPGVEQILGSAARQRWQEVHA